MKIKIPSQDNPILKQTNESSIFGTLTDSFNLDLTSDLGKIKTTKTLLSKKGTAVVPGDFGGTQNEGVGAIAALSNQLWMVSGDALWRGGNSPSDAITKDTSIGTPIVYFQDSDLKSYNQTLVAASQTDLYKYTPGTVTWSSIHTFSNSGQAHLLEPHGTWLYFTFDEYKVGRINTSFTVSTTGTGTLDPNLPGYSITFLKSDGNRLWVGYANVSGGNNQTTLILTWDGSTENVVSGTYKINSRAILAGCIVDGVPHVMDVNGRLLGFNGSFFKKIAKLPLKSSESLFGLGSKFNQRAIHPNGMTYDAVNEEVLVNVSNVNVFSSTPSFFDFPGGIWSYKSETGLIHKYSPSLQPIADSGVTNLVEYGQHNVIYGGALSILGLYRDTSEKGRILFGSTIAVGSTVDLNTTSCTVTLCTDDTANTAQNCGHFTTTEIHSQKVIETWQEIYAVYQKLASANDKIIVKYSTEDVLALTVSSTWSDIDRITTTTDVSMYTVGDEVYFIQGTGSGRAFTIKSITNNAGTYTIVFNNSLPSGVIGLTGVGIIRKWIYLGEVTYSDTEQWKKFGLYLRNVSPMIQIKTEMLFTGDNQVYGNYLITNDEIK